MTYAGRLDPMASGVLIVLAGEEVKNKEKYLALDKEYDFSVLFGFGTDTYDVLGKIISDSFYSVEMRGAERCMGVAFAAKIRENLKYLKGKLRQKYPIYSSKTVNGRPLFSYARNGEEVEIPEREIFIKKLELKKIRKISDENLFKNIEKRIEKVEGDFRQKGILKLWRRKLSNKKVSQSFYVVDFKIKCGSGTYVRAIAQSLGEKVGIPALALSIKRTKIGKFAV